MITRYQELKLGQWLSQTEMFREGTPSNYIIFKTLTNLGATHGEILIYLWRNSIIIEPNVPVIQEKESEEIDGELVYPNMLGVYGKVSKTAVIRYLKSDITPKKIVCTPEAYDKKVKAAILETVGFDLYKDFFLLLDESDKLTTETDYRQKIILPMNDFFLFDKKAMISATPLIPSDPRFEQHGFKILEIVPLYTYKKNINILGTDNTLGTLDWLLKKYPEESYFIFVNSADLIYTIAKLIGMGNCKAFCAPKSVKKLNRMGMENASDTLGGYSKFNLLTSRFFSAVGIKLEDMPNVVILTNVYNAPHSIVDPYTDVVQIAGRLRNGFTRIIHITNFNRKIRYEDEEIARQHINDEYEEYKMIAARLKKVDTVGGKAALTQATQRIDIKKFVDDDHQLLPYMVDNHLYEQKVRSHYRGHDYLKLAYERVECFTTKHHFIRYNISDAQLYNITLATGKSELIKSVSTILHSYGEQKESGVITFRLGDTKADVEASHPEIVKDYHAVGGYVKMKELGFNQAKITREVNRLKKKNELNNPEMVKEIKNWYKVGEKPLARVVRERLKEIYKGYDIAKPPMATDILHYYDAKQTTVSGNKKVWEILGVKK